MSVVITLDDIRAYAEVDYIISHMNEKYRQKVPEKILNFFHDYKDPTYKVNVNPYVPLQKQGLKRYTLEILALFHLKYWCENEERKKELYGLMLENQERLENQMREKYSVEKLFDNANATIVNSIDDLDEHEEFTKPKVVQRYSQYTQNNTDIQDYTDYVSEQSNTTENNDKLPTTPEKPKGLFKKIKFKLSLIFGKKQKSK